MAYLGVLFAFIFTLYTTRFIYRNYDWEWYSLALFFLACLLVSSELLIRLPRMMRKGGPGFFSLKRTMIAAVLAAIGLVHIYLSDYWDWLVIGGAILIAMAWLWPLKKEGETMVLKKGELMTPEEWDEQEIIRSIQSSVTDKGILTNYVDNLKERFVTGQDHKTAEKRLAFLRTLNQFYEEGRKTYGWKRAFADGRPKVEEDTKNIKAAVELERARQELESLINPPQQQPSKKKRTRAECLKYWQSRAQQVDEWKTQEQARILQGMKFEEVSDSQQREYVNIENIAADKKQEILNEIRKCL